MTEVETAAQDTMSLDDKVTVAKLTDTMYTQADREFWDACRLALAENAMVPQSATLKQVYTAWTDTELLALKQLADEHDMTPFQVLRQALRQYQAAKRSLKERGLSGQLDPQ